MAWDILVLRFSESMAPSAGCEKPIFTSLGVTRVKDRPIIKIAHILATRTRYLIDVLSIFIPSK
jgi:hypothetical protein